MLTKYFYPIFIFGMLSCCASTFSFAQADSVLYKLPARSWYATPNTHMRDVCPSYIYDFSNSCAAVIAEYSGGTFDTKRNRMIIWGGGHNGYYQNEIYAFDVTRMKWVLLTESSPPNSYMGPCIEVLSDGAPNSRHTYDGLAYIEHADRMFVYGGSLSCGPGDFSTATWTFAFATNTWHKMDPSGDNPEFGYSVVTTYDPTSKLVYVHDLHNLYTYDFDKNHYNRVSDYFYNDLDNVAALDTKRRLFVIMGMGNLWYYNIGRENYIRQKLVTTGDTEIINSDAPGIKYDPVADRIIAWAGDKVFSLDMDTRVWTSFDVPGKPPSVPEAGAMYGRWQFIPRYNVFIAVTEVDHDVYFYKNTPSGGVTAASEGDHVSHLSSPDIRVYPNPGKSQGSIRIIISHFHTNAREARLSIFNVTGQRIKYFEPLQQFVNNGTISVVWNGRDENNQPLTSGAYFVVLETNHEQFTQQFIFVK